jgi:aspartate/methionine/tyrosine aminotransferase
MTELCEQRRGINLARGFPDEPPPSALQRMATTAIREGFNQYSPTCGVLELRDALAHKLGTFNRLQVDVEKGLAITCGATEALTCSVLAVVDPADEVVVFEPFYESYVPSILIAGGTPDYVPLSDDWVVSEEGVKEAIGSRTKAIIVNTPQNPSGKVYKPDELRLLADLCVDYDLVAISDETYECFTYDGTKHTSLASIEGMAERTLTVGSFSKTFSVTGWRVGYVAASGELLGGVQRVHDYLTLAAPTPFQKAIVWGLNQDGAYYDKVARKHAIKRRILCDALRASGFKFHQPEGAYYVLADFSSISGSDDRGFALELLDSTGIATVPGRCFYSDQDRGRTKVRFSFCKSVATLRECARRLTSTYSDSHPRKETADEQRNRVT